MTAGGTRITLCGTLAVELDGRRVEQDLPGRQGRLVLAYLATRRTRPVSRDELVDVLWPSTPPAEPEEALSALLSKVRRAVGKGVIEGRQELTLVLPAGASIDLEDAATAAERADAALAGSRWGAAWDEANVALRVVSAGFLTGYDAPWVEDGRREVEELRLHALECAAAAGAALGGAELAAGERAARALIEAAPLRESGYRFLMAALAARGNVAEALAVYEDLRVLLRDELGAAPSAAIQALHGRLLAEGAGGPGGAPLVDPLAEPASGDARSQPHRLINFQAGDAPDAYVHEERKLVSVLVADVVAADDLEHTRARLRRLREVAGVEVEAAGGTLKSSIGGGIIAAFGAPAAHEDHADRALQVAEALVAKLGAAVPLRLAVETGEVIASGSGLSGPPVSAAVALLAQADGGDLLVGERARAAAGRRERGRRGATPFAGRADELDVLRSDYRRACAGRQPRLVTIVGDAGVGKSRLAREFVARLMVESPTPRSLIGRCLSYGRGVTYRALGDVLADVFGLHESDARETIVGRLGARQILGLTLGLDVAGDVHPLAAVQLMREAWRELLSELAAQRPIVVVVEDLHWAQDDLFDLLEHLLDGVGGPLLLVGTARPELDTARPSWGRRGNATTVWLEPLPQEEARKLVEKAPAGLRELVLKRAEGNPFFIEELLARIGSGAELAIIPDSVQAVLAARIDQLPPLEKQALQAAAVVGRAFWREPVRELLGGAAPSFELLEERDFVRPRLRSSFEGIRELAFKHTLTREVAYAALPRDRRARLHAGVAQWLEDFGGGRDEHAAILAHHFREAVRPENADLAWASEDVKHERLRAKAIMWLCRAAELAVRRYEIDGSIDLLQQALQLEPDTDTRCTVWRSLARANSLKFDGEAFWTAMEAALEAAGDDCARAEISSQLAVESYVRAGMWTKTPALERVGGWITRALELSQPGTAARAQALIATACRDLDDAGAAAEAAAIAERLDDPELCVHAWDACAAVAMAAADYEAAWRWRTRRLQLLDRITDPDLRTIIAETPYSACVATCRFDQAREIATLHDELTRSLTPHHRLHGAAILVEVEELLGNWPGIRDLEDRVRATVAANTGNPCLRNARSLLVCALAAACLDDTATAAELERAADDLGSPNKPLLDAVRLRLALARGDHMRAEQLLTRLEPDHGWYSRGHGTSLATLIARLDGHAALGHRDQLERDAPRLLAPGTFVEPFALRAVGLVRKDRVLIEQSLVRFDELALDWHAAETRALLPL